MNKLKDIPVNDLKSAFKQAKYWKDICIILDISDSSYNMQKLHKFVEDNNIDISHFTKHKKEDYDKNPKVCECCGKPLPWEQRFNKYCSNSCSAKINNQRICRNGKDVNGFCLNCGKPLHFGNKKYCCKECQIEVEQNQFIERWKQGLESGTKGKHQISTTIRRYLLTLNDYKCQKCGWGEKNPITNSVPLAIHHIDGDCTNNSFENLQVLCPNCHSLTDNFGSLNKESKRFHRKKLTKEREN